MTGSLVAMIVHDKGGAGRSVNGGVQVAVQVG